MSEEAANPLSTENSIARELSNELRHPSTDMPLFIHVLDQDTREKCNKVWNLNTMERHSISNRIKAILMRKLIEVAAASKAKGLAKLFPQAPHGANAALQRQHCKVRLIF